MTQKIRLYLLRGLLLAAVTASIVIAHPTFAAGTGSMNGGG